jgi:hypothetical protein
MLQDMSDTATTSARLMTPPGRGGIAVIALAGPATRRILDQCFRPRTTHTTDHAHPAASYLNRGQAPVPPRQEVVQPVLHHPQREGRPDATSPETTQLQLGEILDGRDVIDEAIVAATPRGAEINIHGGPAATRRVLQRLADLGAQLDSDRPASLLSPAHPMWNNPAIGEELLASRPQAPSLFVAACLANQWSAGLSQLAAETLNALPNNLSPGAMPAPQACDLAEQLRQAAGRLTTMQKLLDPPEVVLAGPPNAGKSTLANALIGRPVSIVHDTAGTTRDWIREQAILDGRAVWLTDTAGLWDVDDHVDSCCAEQDAEAVRRAWDRIDAADLVLICTPADNKDSASNELLALRRAEADAESTDAAATAPNPQSEIRNPKSPIRSPPAPSTPRPSPSPPKPTWPAMTLQFITPNS